MLSISSLQHVRDDEDMSLSSGGFSVVPKTAFHFWRWVRVDRAHLQSWKGDRTQRRSDWWIEWWKMEVIFTAVPVLFPRTQLDHLFLLCFPSRIPTGTLLVLTSASAGTLKDARCFPTPGNLLLYFWLLPRAALFSWQNVPIFSSFQCIHKRSP